MASGASTIRPPNDDTARRGGRAVSVAGPGEARMGGGCVSRRVRQPKASITFE